MPACSRRRWSGTLDVKDSEINNSGTGALGIVIDATSELLVDVASLKLDGTGQVSLIGGTITGQAASAGNELNNFDNTIVGTGTISNIDLDNAAAGIIHVTGGTLILNTGTTVDNAGLLEATLGGTLDVKDSEINNSGTGALGIVIDATSKLLVDAASLALDGGGQVSLTASTITGAAPSAGDELENVDNTIVGTGTISNIHLVNDAAGIIHVTGGTLVLNTGATIDNAGLLEATVSGELDVKDSEIDNSGAGTLGIVIDATSELLVDVASLALDGGGQVSLMGGIITGQAASSGNELNNLDNTIVGTGTISNIDLDNAGTIDATGGTLILTTGTTIDNSGLLEATSGGTLDVKDGEINNSGTGGRGIAVGAASKLLIDVASLKLDGGGQVSLTGGTITGQAAGSGNELNNVDNTIVGFGTISNIHLDNDAAGTIDATGGTLILNTGATINNAGLLEATSGGTLDVKDTTIDNTGTGARGIVVGAASKLLVDVASLKLEGGGQVSFTGGTLTGAAPNAGNELENVNNTIVGFGTISNIDLDNDVAGTINATGGTLTLATGTVIDNAGLLEATSHGVLDVKDSEIHNTGTSTAGTGILIDGTSTLLVDVGLLKLDGGGTVTLEGTITGAAPNAGNELEDVDNPITATGPAATISNLHFVNGTTLLVTGGTLTLNDDQFDNFLTSGLTTTYGTITIDSTGTLALTGDATINDGVLDNLGHITVSGTGNEIENENGSNGPGGSGGTNIFTNSGTLEVLGGGVLTLLDDLVTNTLGTIVVDATGTLYLTGSDPTVGVTINGGALNEAGNIVVTGGDNEIQGITATDVGNNSQLTVEGGTLTLDNDYFSGGIITITVDAGATLNIDNSILKDVILHNLGGTINVSNSTVQTVNSVLTGTTTVLPGTTLVLVDETVFGTITNDGTIDVETAGVPPNGAEFDGVVVTNAGPGEGIEVGLTTTATLLLDDGTVIVGGYLKVGGTSTFGTVDVEKGSNAVGPYGATLDGVAVTNVAAGDGLEVGTTSTATLTLVDGTTVTGGYLTIGGASTFGTVDVEKGGNAVGPYGATLDDVTVTNAAAGDGINIGTSSTATLLVDDGTAISGGTLTVGTTGTLDVEKGTSGPGATLDGVKVTDSNAGATTQGINIGTTSTATLPARRRHQ